MGFRDDINGLRALCIALVVAYHLQLKGAAGGFIGVDVFFVISGYLMTKIVWTDVWAGRFGYWRFVGARAWRIWPALAALILVLFVVGAFWLPPFDLRILAEQAQWALLFASNHFFLAHSGYHTQTADTLWLLHTWSLSLEWQFYLLYPLVPMGVAVLARRFGPAAGERAARGWLIAALAALALLSLGDQAARLRNDADGSFFLLSSRAWELLAGGLAYVLGLRAQERPAAWRVAASHAGVLLVLGSALAIALLRLRPVGMGPLMALPVLGTALVLWSADAKNPLLHNRIAHRVGLWSYSIYLWHWPLLVGLRVTDLPLAHPGWTAAIAIAASLLLGGLSYHLVERRAWRAAAKPLLAMGLAGAGTLVVAVTGGLEFRSREGHDFQRDYRAQIKPLSFPDACSNFKLPPERLQTCTIDKGSRRRILVIGDSHAEHFYHWFAAHSAASVDFFTAAECPPVPRFERLQPGFRCREYAALAWGRAASAGYDAVVVAARWPTVGVEPGPPYCWRGGDGGCTLLTGAARRQRVAAELREAIERTLRAGKQVVVVAGSPEAPFRVPERLTREAFWHGRLSLTVPLQPLLDETAWIESLFREMQAQPGFHFVSLRERLCERGACRLYDEALRRPIYFDESHFDPVWIAAQKDLFAPFAMP